MPLKFYIGQTSQGQPWPPDHTHEAAAAVDLIKRLWLAFQHQDIFYAAIVNLRWPSADIVVISEYGLGVVELKHYFGPISQMEGLWYAGPMPIKAGADSRGYRNPHEQVQAYAVQIREKLLNPPPRREPWLPGSLADWPTFKVATAVCFTNPDVKIEPFRTTLRRQRLLNLKPWERFTVLMPDELPEWAVALRFEQNQGPRKGFDPYRLTPKQIVHMATQLLKGTEWTEITNLMPTGEPYAYLTRIEDGQRIATYSLTNEAVIIGRKHTCDVFIPQGFSRVSREHARLTRTLDGIFINDLGSTNGTFVNEQRIRRQQLEHGQQISLGGPSTRADVCVLEFSLDAFDVHSTAFQTQVDDE